MINLDTTNPGWIRPHDWPYPEDWGSPAWERRIAGSFARSLDLRRKFGFIVCPKCDTGHTSHTLTCRDCDYRITIPREPES